MSLNAENEKGSEISEPFYSASINEKLTKFNNVGEHINSGGCGIYALAVYRMLNNLGYLNFKLCAYVRDESDKKNIKVNNNIVGNVPAHVVLVYRNMVIDAEYGAWYIDEFDELQQVLSRTPVMIDFIERDLVNAINDVYRWNWLFDRVMMVPQFEECFGVDLSDIIV